MEIFFIITLVLALIITSAIMAGKNKVNNLNKENIHKNTNDDDVIKIKKSTPILIIAGALIVIASVMIYKEYKEYRQEQEAIKMLNALGKELEPYNESMKKNIKNIDKMNDELYKQFEKMNKK